MMQKPLLNRRDLGLGLVAAVSAPGWGGTGQTRSPAANFSTEFITFPSRGRRIRAALLRPLGTARDAGVVFMHGSGGVSPNQVDFAQRFVADGYMTLVPTYLDAAADDIVRPPRVMNAWRDCGVDAVERLIAEGIEPGRTAIMGYSLGSHVAVDGALGGGRAAAAVGIAGGWDVYVPRSPARRIPVLIVRAELDASVRPQGTERWRRFLEERNVAVLTRVVRGARHDFTPEEWGEVFRYVSEFLQGRIGSSVDRAGRPPVANGDIVGTRRSASREVPGRLAPPPLLVESGT